MKRDNLRVYFIKPIGMAGPIKIGCSNLPQRRLEQLSTWSPFPLEVIGSVPGGYKDELYVHACFDAQFLHREWFAHSPELERAISDILAAGTVDVLRERFSAAASRRTRRRNWTPEHSLRMSYHMRMHWSERTLRKNGEDTCWHAPEDVRGIMRRWGYSHPHQSPTPAEIARLDQYLADPVAHSVQPDWRSAA
jgi:hypothetical protein